MALGSTQPQTETSIRNISWGGVKAAGTYTRFYQLLSYSLPSSALCLL